MSRLPHGYTNRTRRLDGDVIEKRYVGHAASIRAATEYLCLTSLSDRLPLPEVIARDESGPSLLLRAMPGAHGQDLIEAGRPREVLARLGSTLAVLRAIDATTVPELPGRGPVIVHGDFGPQNVLIDEGRVSAILDWEFAHLGSEVEDLAWTEWIVRMHHDAHRDALPTLFAGAGFDPGWTARQAAMVDRCLELLRHAEDAGPSDLRDQWRRRLLRTEAWSE